MGRTPLFRIVERSLAAARVSARTGVPPDELRERFSSPVALTRRHFLQVGGAVAAGWAAGCGGLAYGPSVRSAPVVVVGGGIAGLTAAYRLHQQGIAVRVLEAQNRVGGRMYSLRGYFPDDQVAELGGELIDTGHESIRRLAGELEIELDDLAAEDPLLDTDLWVFGGRRRSEAEVVRAFLPAAERIEEALATLSGDVTYRSPSGGEALDRLPLAEWLAELPVEPWLRDLLDVAYTTEYGLETAEQSTLNLILLIDPDPDPFRIFGESDERFHVHQGNDAITTELAVRLRNRVETGTVVEAVQERPDGSFTLSVKRAAGASELHAEHVVLAVPFTLLREIRLEAELPAVKRRAIDTLGYGTNAKLMLGVSERVWRTEHGSNGSVLAELPFQLTWETSRGQAGRSGILTNFTGGRHGMELGQGTTAEQAAAAVGQLETIFPGMTAAHAGQKAVRFLWPSAPWARGSYACYLPGQWTGIAGAEGERVRRLHFAGEHTSLAAQGFMEGGCESGERAAREVLADLGVAVARTAAVALARAS